MNKIHFAVEGRNGYWAIDEYQNPNGDKYSGCIRHVESFEIQKQANSVCSYLNYLADQINKANRFLNHAEKGMPQDWLLVSDIKQFLTRYRG